MDLEINEKVSSLAGGESGGAAPLASERAVALAEMFGIGLDERHEVELYRDFRLTVRRGEVVYITGQSGCGKSVLLRALARAIRERLAAGPGGDLHGCGAAMAPGGGAALGPDDPVGPVAELESVDLSGEAAVVDRFGSSLEEALRLASVAGLNDAFLLLRPPWQLSDGQRYRYRLAALLAGGAGTVVIDEFCSTLDRRTARAVAYRVRKYADRTGTTFLVATAHDDLEEDLAADVRVIKRSAGQVEVRRIVNREL